VSVLTFLLLVGLLLVRHFSLDDGFGKYKVVLKILMKIK